jgi:DNA-binding MarR family transcriptional regulator
VDHDSVTRLRRVIGRLNRQLVASATSEGLTPSEASVLGQVATRGPLSLAQLADLELLNPTMLSRVVGTLDGHGLLRRVRNPDDLRAALVEITDEGMKVHGRVTEARNAVVSECADKLPVRQVAALEKALPALEALAEELVSDVRRGR